MLDLKRIITILIIVIVIIGIITGAYFYIKGKQENESQEISEYVPEEEISEEQMRETMLSLYFKSNEKLIPEARLIDVKELLNNPYEKILKMLIEGPKSDKLEKTIPEGTKINKIEKEGETLVIDFSKEFISNHQGGELEEKLTINSIVNTLTELTEVNGIRIKIDGENDKSFKDNLIKFNNVFTRE